MLMVLLLNSERDAVPDIVVLIRSFSHHKLVYSWLFHGQLLSSVRFFPILMTVPVMR